MTITGGGFPAQANRTAVRTGAASIVVGEQPCEVEQSSFSQIVCRTAAQQNVAGLDATSIGGFFVGGRGVDTYLFPSGGSFSYGNMTVCQRPATIAGSAHDACSHCLTTSAGRRVL
jgi:hypothetical protein